MRTETIEIYKIGELSEKAQEKAHENWNTSNSFEYVWLDEYRDTLKAFADLFPVKVKDYGWSTYGHSYTKLTFTGETEIELLSGHRLAAYIWNNYRSIWTKKYYGSFSRPASEERIYHRKLDHQLLTTTSTKHWYAYHGLKLETGDCPFTGFCADADILDPIWKFLRQPANITFGELLDDCAEPLTESVVAEMESQQSFEYFVDHAEANEMEFTADGEQCYRI